MTVIYVTKYALSSGIFKVNATLGHNDTTANWSENGYQHFVSGKDFWLTPEEALADCERRREAKLKSLYKQKYKIETLQFIIE